MGLFGRAIGNAGEIDPDEATEELQTLLGEGEHIDLAYKLVRDMMVLTNRRLILIDKQGLTGRKVEYRSIPYKSITTFSVETAGHLDLDAELKLWISGQAEPLEESFTQDANIYALQAVLAARIAGK
jgi:hypothetical protein